ncbi:hypothetical protein GCM10008179_17930 [Hansschlegelia plantiphila]|uniref:Uncharacterized protein n=2 Tax=Hansschlegelia plantiphila TaxID=374655 RepID=A0A9W6MVU2_9HYPH|nr:hypothetical protein GCM10008179_17930 [Hansschlegelia plantiphila]
MHMLWVFLTWPGQLVRLVALVGGSGTWSVMGSPLGVLMSSTVLYMLGYLLFFSPGP